MFGDQSTLWPIHPKPIDGEILSSWISRIAAGFGLSLFQFYKLMLSRPKGVGIDIDKVTDLEFFEILARGTGITAQRATQTSFVSDKGHVYSRRVFNNLEWIIPLGTSHKHHKQPGIPFCPSCLAEDSVPYYRKHWRYGFLPVCPHHGLLTNRCPVCNHPYHYQGYSRYPHLLYPSGTLGHCRGCGHKFHTITVAGMQERELASVLDIQNRIMEGLDSGWVSIPGREPVHICLYLRGLHDLALIFQRYNHGKQAVAWVGRETGMPVPIWGRGWSGTIESRMADIRAWLLLFADWLAREWPDRLVAMTKALNLTPPTVLTIDKNRPFWIGDHAIDTKTRATQVPCKEEIANATQLLRQRRNWPASSSEVEEFMRTGIVPDIRPLRPSPTLEAKKAFVATEMASGAARETIKRIHAQANKDRQENPRELYGPIYIDPLQEKLESDIREASEDIEALRHRERWQEGL